MITQHRFHSNYQPTKMPHQLSGGTFSHAVQKEEGFGFCFFLFSVRSFHSHAAVYSPRRFQERERSAHHLQQRHTQREKEGKVEHLSNFHNTCMETQTHLPARLEHSMTDLSSNRSHEFKPSSFSCFLST